MSLLLRLLLACTPPRPSAPVVTEAPPTPVSAAALGLVLQLPAVPERHEPSADHVVLQWGNHSVEVRAGADLASWRAGLALVGEATLGAEQPRTVCGQPAVVQVGWVVSGGGTGFVAGPGGELQEHAVDPRRLRVAALVDAAGRQVAWSAPADAPLAEWETLVAGLTCAGPTPG